MTPTKRHHVHDPDQDPETAQEKATMYDEWGQFFCIPNEFIDHSADLTDQAFRLYAILRAYPKITTEQIQQRVDWPDTVIEYALEELETAGWVKGRGRGDERR